MHCAIDFGTSNSAIAIPDGPQAMRLVELEPGHRTMPTAVFYFVDGPETHGPPRAFGRAAIGSYWNSTSRNPAAAAALRSAPSAAASRRGSSSTKNTGRPSTARVTGAPAVRSATLRRWRR